MCIAEPCFEKRVCVLQNHALKEKRECVLQNHALKRESVCCMTCQKAAPRIFPPFDDCVPWCVMLFGQSRFSLHMVYNGPDSLLFMVSHSAGHRLTVQGATVICLLSGRRWSSLHVLEARFFRGRKHASQKRRAHEEGQAVHRGRD